MSNKEDDNKVYLYVDGEMIACTTGITFDNSVPTVDTTIKESKEPSTIEPGKEWNLTVKASYKNTYTSIVHIKSMDDNEIIVSCETGPIEEFGIPNTEENRGIKDGDECTFMIS